MLLTIDSRSALAASREIARLSLSMAPHVGPASGTLEGPFRTGHGEAAPRLKRTDRMASLELEYNTEQSELEEILKSVNRTGDYYAHGQLQGFPPRMTVSGVGRIAYPILDRQVADLLAVAEQAPYGRGPETLLDRSVRDCWQIGAEDVELGGPAWRRSIQTILRRAAKGLGLPPNGVAVELYKVLIYERDGFFDEHRDTEKADGMIGTLVVGLPVEGEGGELEVQHAGQQVKLDVSVDDLGVVPYAAFYADCVHRTLPVRSGHRVSLVFNLMVRQGAKGVPTTPSDLTSTIDRLTGLLAGWPQWDDPPQKLAWLLDHHYSEKGLSFSGLKGLDLPVGQALLAAARKADCLLHLAVLKIDESGIPLSDYFDPEYYGREVDYTGVDCELYEVNEVTCKLIGWEHPEGGNRLGVRGIPLYDCEALPRGAMDGAEPDSQTLFEATGNGGASVSRSYRRAAFVIWPRSGTIEVLVNEGIAAAVDFVCRELEAESNPTTRRKRRESMLGQLLKAWPDRRYKLRYSGDRGRERLPARKTLELLAEVGDQDLTAHFLLKILPVEYVADLNPVLLPVLKSASTVVLSKSLSALVQKDIAPRIAGVANLLASLACQADGTHKMGLREILRLNLKPVLRDLPKALGVDKGAGDRWSYRNREAVLDAGAIRDLFMAGASLDLGSELDKVVGLLREHPATADPWRAIPLALREISDHSPDLLDWPAAMVLWRHSAGQLLARSRLPPSPTDISIDAPLRCSCAHCLRLKRFCESPTQRAIQFKAVQDTRMHLESEIRRAKLDVACTTNKRGRPFTLVCRKTAAGPAKRRARYENDVDSMRMLVDASPSTPKADLSKLRKSLCEAINRYGGSDSG